MIGISGIGIYESSNKITINELAPNLTPEMRKKTGIESVPVELQLSASKMAAMASTMAIQDAQITPLDINMIINTQSSMHDYLIWQVAAAIQSDLEAWNAVALDVYQGCSGFVAGMILAKNTLLSQENTHTALVCTSEKWEATIKGRMSGLLVFGDGAAAAIIEKTCTQNIILGHSTICRGYLNDVSRMTIGAVNRPQASHPDEYYYYGVVNLQKAMDEMIPINTDLFYEVGIQAIKNSNLELKDIRHAIFPNVGFGLFNKVMNRFGIDLENTNHRYVATTGDSGTVDVLLSYYRMLRDKIIESGDHVLILCQGAGTTWSAMIIRV